MWLQSLSSPTHYQVYILFMYFTPILIYIMLFYFIVASAVENADVVLICMSQKYKDSPNCRLEGEYCMNQKAKYIPLMMQRGYQPDGWYTRDFFVLFLFWFLFFVFVFFFCGFFGFLLFFCLFHFVICVIWPSYLFLDFVFCFLSFVFCFVLFFFVFFLLFVFHFCFVFVLFLLFLFFVWFFVVHLCCFVRLGMMLGAKFYHNFHDEEDWDAKVGNLINGIFSLFDFPFFILFYEIYFIIYFSNYRNWRAWQEG
jgi:hypothetical protein